MRTGCRCWTGQQWSWGWQQRHPTRRMWGRHSSYMIPGTHGTCASIEASHTECREHMCHFETTRDSNTTVAVQPSTECPSGLQSSLKGALFGGGGRTSCHICHKVPRPAGAVRHKPGHYHTKSLSVWEHRLRWQSAGKQVCQGGPFPSRKVCLETKDAGGCPESLSTSPYNADGCGQAQLLTGEVGSLDPHGSSLLL
jgi:hypothetical protein